MVLSGYKAMWLMTLFDLPTITKKQRKAYTVFRKHLIEDGFQMIQYSTYIRPCPSEENTDVHLNRIKANLPPEGSIRAFKFTDKQYERSFSFTAGKSVSKEPIVEQLELF